MGIQVEDAAKHVQDLGLKVDSGAVVLSVKPGSAAQRRKIRRGDVIVGLTYKRIKSAADLRRVGRSVRSGQKFHIIVKRGAKLYSFKMRFY